MPDWELRRWDETNSKLHFRFMRTAQQNRNWAAMSDLMRLLAVYLEGGVYMDTDVEVVKPLDDLRGLSAFFGIETEEPVVNSAVIGAEQGHPFLLECVRALLRRCDGNQPANVSGPLLVTRVLKRAGLAANSEAPQRIGAVTVFPRRYFYPFSYRECFTPECVTPDTYTIHWWAKSWL